MNTLETFKVEAKGMDKYQMFELIGQWYMDGRTNGAPVRPYLDFIRGKENDTSR